MGERIYPKNIKGIKDNHFHRYYWALTQLKANIPANGRVLDAACGVGYGSYMMAENGFLVHAIDYSDEAAESQKKHWDHPNVSFELARLEDSFFGHYDAVVSIETIEHMKDDSECVAKMKNAADLLIITVPNQNVVPYGKNPWHYRHYTQDDLRALFGEWVIHGWATQYTKRGKKSKMVWGCDGMTIGAVASSPHRHHVSLPGLKKIL